MRFQILRADVRPTKPITVAPDIDAVVVAGDVCEGAQRGFATARRIVPVQIPVVCVLGKTVVPAAGSPRHSQKLANIHRSRAGAAIRRRHGRRHPSRPASALHPSAVRARSAYGCARVGPDGGIEAGQPELLVHGHVHSSFDYRVSATRMVCSGSSGENSDFISALVADITPLIAALHEPRRYASLRRRPHIDQQRRDDPREAEWRAP